MDITEETFYGKPLGGCCYGGIPMEKIVKIQLNEIIHIELNIFVFVTEDLSYEVRFDWGSTPDWKYCHYQYKRDDFKNIIKNVSSWDETQWSEDSFLDITIDAEMNLLRIGTVFLKIIENKNSEGITGNKVLVLDFLERIKLFFQKLVLETEELYHRQQNIIGW